MSLIDTMALLAGVLVLAKLLAGLFDRLKIPAVLAELLLGVLLGNLGGHVGSLVNSLQATQLIQGLSELGVLLLLFMVGLETSFQEMRTVGKEAFLAAIYGVIAPFVLAFIAIPLVSRSFFSRTLFMAAALTATSVGITARVLKDAGKLKIISGRIILGAAVIDDVIGIAVLAVVSSLVLHGSISIAGLLLILLRIVLFAAAVALVHRLLPRTLALLKPFEVPGTVITILVSLCLLASWAAEKAGLAGIIGAFALGLALEDAHFRGFRESSRVSIHELIKPLSDFLVPVFFVIVGMRVKLAALGTCGGLTLSGILILCAIAGKMACSFAVSQKPRAMGADPLLVGLGMMPRGEVGLIFAVMGEKMGILNPLDYAAIVTMTAATTFLAPVAINWRAARLQTQ
jgi:Kef-type K+ transport system membrane component KefB